MAAAISRSSERSITSSGLPRLLYNAFTICANCDAFEGTKDGAGYVARPRYGDCPGVSHTRHGAGVGRHRFCRADTAQGRPRGGVQGRAPAGADARRSGAPGLPHRVGFREAGNAVLFGNQTFWEGVDVPGAALSCVVIAKLPFRVPTHPLERGRIEEIERRGENSFRCLAVPQAVLALKQGVGRLIRSRTDRGVVVIADNRLHQKSYGRTFLSSLPDFSRHLGTRADVLREIDAFFADADADADADEVSAGSSE